MGEAGVWKVAGGSSSPPVGVVVVTGLMEPGEGGMKDWGRSLSPGLLEIGRAHV